MVAPFALQTDQYALLHFSIISFPVSFKIFLSTFIYVIHTNYNTVNFRLNSSLKPVEQLTYTVRTATCCSGLLLICGCFRLSCECRFVNPQYHFFPAVSDWIHCVRKLIYITTLKTRLLK